MPILVPSLHRRRLLLAGGALALSGCANAPSSAEITARFPATQAVLDRFVAEGRLPGATVGVRAPDGSDWFLQSGRLSFDPASPAMDRDTLFRIYSMTKLITGAAGTQAWVDKRQNFAAVMMIQAMPYGAVNILRDVRPALDQDLGIER